MRSIGSLALLTAAVLSTAMASAGLGAYVASGGSSARLITVVLFGASIWLTLSIGYGVAVAAGGFDALVRSRVASALGTSVLIGTVVGVSGLCAALGSEGTDQVPRALRPLIGWAPFVLPQITVLAGLIALYPSLRRALPRAVVHLPLFAAAAIAGSACIALGLDIWSIARDRAAHRHAQRVQAVERRDALVLLEIEGLDAQADLGRLLEWTAGSEPVAIRAAALAKVRAHPDLTGRLATMLRDEWRGEALTFLADNDPPDAAALARPLADAILLIAADVRREIRDAHALRADHFDSRCARVLAAADRFGASGADYVPAIRALRVALDEPRVPAFDPWCRRRIDRWLALHER